MSEDECPVCDGTGLVWARAIGSGCTWQLSACLPCSTPQQFLAVLAAREALLHDGDCCDPDDAA